MQVLLSNPRQRLFSAHIKSKSSNTHGWQQQQPVKAIMLDDDATAILAQNKNMNSISSSIVGAGFLNYTQGTIEEQCALNVSTNKNNTKHQRNHSTRSSFFSKNNKNRPTTQSQIENRLYEKPFIISSYVNHQGYEDEFSSKGHVHNKMIGFS